jgi:hypothetical protein
VVELGRSEAPGRPYLYGTGFDFLERFGLTSLDELPPLDAEIAGRLIETSDADDGGLDGVADHDDVIEPRSVGPGRTAS